MPWVCPAEMCLFRSQIDVCNTESIAAAVGAIMRTHGRLDVLVNNVGIKARTGRAGAGVEPAGILRGGARDVR
jgi:NAD(P)-dependent dehydrogenase (short-subunit alcohol dehydrogenase family)